jgi:hypothetical protein
MLVIVLTRQKEDGDISRLGCHGCSFVVLLLTKVMRRTKERSKEAGR